MVSANQSENFRALRIASVADSGDLQIVDTPGFFAVNSLLFRPLLSHRP